MQYTLPISDYDLDLIDEPGEATLGRRGEIVGAHAHMQLPPNMEFTAKYRIPKERYGD